MSRDAAAELRFETFEAFLDWEVEQPGRYELDDGYVVLLSGAGTTLDTGIA
jgi:hypothetical protein